MIAYNEVARIYCQEEQTSVIVSHQQMNGIGECESIMVDTGLMYMEKSIRPRSEPQGTPECNNNNIIISRT